MTNKTGMHGLFRAASLLLFLAGGRFC